MYYIILCRSMTNAQKAARLLQRNGIFAAVTKVPQEANPGGCAYGVKVAERKLNAARELLARNQIAVLNIISFGGNGNWGTVS